MEGKGFLGRGLLGTASMFVMLFALGASAQAGNFTVSKLADDGSSGSLRKAIDDANIASGPDQIVFASGLSGTINLTSDLPQITSPLTITGPGMDVVQVDGSDQFRPVTSFQSLKISGLGLLNGSTDGWSAITASAELELDGVRVSGGTSGDGFGGAIYAVDIGSLVLKNSLIAGNDARGGGGVYASGTDVTISNTRFSDNKATSASSGGGAVLVVGGDLTVSGSEFTSNSASEQGGGGILARVGDDQVNISGSTFTGNTVVSEANLFKAGGGAVSIDAANTAITGSEFSGNSSNRQIGGLLIIGNSSISKSLIADNEAEGVAAIMLGDTFPAPPPVCSIEDSTISGNVAQYTFGAIKDRKSVV